MGLTTETTSYFKYSLLLLLMSVKSKVVIEMLSTANTVKQGCYLSTIFKRMVYVGFHKIPRVMTKTGCVILPRYL